MGCNCSKDEDGDDRTYHQSKHHHHHGRKKSYQTLPDTPDGPITHMSESKLLKGFNVLYTDFIGERSGKITDHYELLRPPLGKGACGEVRKGIHKRTGVVRAVKIIYKDSTDKEEQKRLVNEVNILKKLDHPNIMKVYEFFQDEGHFYIVSEYLDGGELFDKITKMKSFTEKQAASTMKQILSAVSYCHDQNIVHRDLKPENILYESKDSDSNIKIVDFGTSISYDRKTQMKQKFGTAYYIAPEVLKGSYTEKCDVWSCGVIMYVLLCGFPPFFGETDREVLFKVSLGRISFDYPEWSGVSEAAKKLITKMLEIDPKKRYTAQEALKDPWFASALGQHTFDKPLAVSALTHLKKLRAVSKLQHAVWIFLVTYFATKEDQAKLMKTFQALDLNGDGQLSREELIKGYQTYMNSPNPEDEVDAIMQSVDINNSGFIDYTEFVLATISKQNMLKKEKLEALFKVIDKDGNGYLTADELEEVFNPGKQKDIDEKVWPELIKEFDVDGDGKISLNEFKDMMSKLI